MADSRKPSFFPRTIWLTPLGSSFLAITLAVGLVAFITGVNLLYLLLAMLLSAVLCSGILSELNMRRLVIQALPPQRIYAERPAFFLVVVRNVKRLIPSYALSADQPATAGGPPVSQYLLKLPAGQSAVLTHALTIRRRGRHWLPGVRLSTRFPFGLFTKTWRPLLDQPILVFPAVRALALAEQSALATARRAGRVGARRGQSAGLHSLRGYRDGDDPRLIHWKTSARVGSLTVKELEDEDRPRLSLAVQDPAPGTLPDLVEANISLAASVAAHAVHRGWEVQLVLADGRTGLGNTEAHLDRILERLALYETPARPRPLPAGTAGEEIRVRLDAPTPLRGVAVDR
jgi:uncharacterized protein (DUF58 family)